MMNDADWAMMAGKYPCQELKKPTGESTDRWLTCVTKLAFAPKTMGLEDGKWSAALLFPANVDLSALKEAAGRVAVARWGDKAGAMGLRTPFKEQSELAGKYEGFGTSGVFINVSSKFVPEFYAADGRTMITLSSDVLWSGCFVRAGLTCYHYEKDAQGKAIKPGVSFGLAFLQFIAEGEKLSGGINAADYLQPIAGVGATPAAAAPAQASAPISAPLF